MKRSARSRAAGKQKGVIPMQPRMKVAAVVIAVALIAVVGLIVITGLEKAEPHTQATVAATTATPEAAATPDPSTEPDDADKETQAQDDAAQNTMYEGALAGLTEEEIEQQALAEEALEGAGGAMND